MNEQKEACFTFIPPIPQGDEMSHMPHMLPQSISLYSIHHFFFFLIMLVKQGSGLVFNSVNSN